MSTITLSTNTAAAARERSATRTSALTSLLATAKKTVEALGEGLAAYQRYETLRSRGMSDVNAARTAFDLDRRA